MDPLGADRCERRCTGGRAAHWLLLLLLAADRVDAWESHLASFATSRPDNPIGQTGVLSESMHHGISSTGQPVSRRRGGSPDAGSGRRDVVARGFPATGVTVGRWLRRAGIELEGAWDAIRRARRAQRTPEDLRIDVYFGHGSGAGVVVRGRVLDDPPPAPELEGESVWAAVRRTLARFSTHELPDVPLRIRLAGQEVEAVTDDEGYFSVRLDLGAVGSGRRWLVGHVELAGPYRGITSACTTDVRVRLSGPATRFGVISDVDDTIIHTGAQRFTEMVRRTVTGTALTRTPLPGAAELYQALSAGDANPVFYVSSSPWNLHDFLTSFLRRRRFPLGPLLLRDLLGDDPDRTHAGTKHASISEVLELHPGVPFVLIGDSGQHDPEIYAEVVRRHPDRILAVYIREVRLDPGDGRVEAVSDAWNHQVPFVLAADSVVMARHAAAAGLLASPEVDRVVRAVEGGLAG